MDIDRPFSRVTFHEFRKWKSGRILGGLGASISFAVARGEKWLAKQKGGPGRGEEEGGGILS